MFLFLSVFYWRISSTFLVRSQEARSHGHERMPPEIDKVVRALILQKKLINSVNLVLKITLRFYKVTYFHTQVE